MVDPYAFREEFRTFKPDLDFGLLEEALDVNPPADNTPAEQKYLWVADTINGLQPGLEASLLPYGFNKVYGALSNQIYSRLSEYTCKGDLARIGVKFEGLYHAPVAATVDFLKGDNDALERIKPSWMNSFMNVRTLRERARLRAAQDRSSSRYRHLLGREATTGILAHIEEDLEESITRAEPQSAYYGDFKLQVGRDISTTIDRLAPDIIPGHSIVRAMASPWLKWYIASRREAAYQNHESYMKAVSSVEKNAVRDAAGNQAKMRSEVLHVVGGTALGAVRLTERVPETPRLTELTERVIRWVQSDQEDQSVAA